MNYWDNTWQYKRIQEMLNDYWITEKDEYAVSIIASFIHADGRTQEKQVIWFSPSQPNRITFDIAIRDIDKEIEKLRSKRRHLLELRSKEATI